MTSHLHDKYLYHYRWVKPSIIQITILHLLLFNLRHLPFSILYVCHSYLSINTLDLIHTVISQTKVTLHKKFLNILMHLHILSKNISLHGSSWEPSHHPRVSPSNLEWPCAGTFYQPALLTLWTPKSPLNLYTDLVVFSSYNLNTSVSQYACMYMWRKVS